MSEEAKQTRTVTVEITNWREHRCTIREGDTVICENVIREDALEAFSKWLIEANEDAVEEEEEDDEEGLCLLDNLAVGMQYLDRAMADPELDPDYRRTVRNCIKELESVSESIMTAEANEEEDEEEEEKKLWGVSMQKVELLSCKFVMVEAETEEEAREKALEIAEDTTWGKSDCEKDYEPRVVQVFRCDEDGEELADA